MTQYDEAVAEAKRLVKRSEEDQWRLAELTWQQCAQATHGERGARQEKWAADIGVSTRYVRYLMTAWEDWNQVPTSDRPKFADAYAEAKGLPVDRGERREMEAISSLRTSIEVVDEDLTKQLSLVS